MAQTVWQELGALFRETMREEARRASPPVRRAVVLKASPLSVDMDGEVLTEGDEDVEIDQSLKTTPPTKGDVVRVHTDASGDYLISGRITNG